MEIENWILQNCDIEYADFTSKLMFTGYKVYGIRIPLLRNKAKEIVNKFGIDGLKFLTSNNFEEVLLQGLVIGYAKNSIVDKIPYIYEYLLKCDNWSLVDSFATTIKPKKDELDTLYEFIVSIRNDEHEYVRRFAIVKSLSQFLDDEHIDDILLHSISLKDETESNKKANGWLLATAYINYAEKILKKIDVLDEKTYRITKSKIRDSFRISKESKERFIRK